MSRSVINLIAVLVLALALFHVNARADVTGSLDVDINLTPEGTQTEAVKYNIDLEANLQINITLSGMTLGADLGFGIPGIEFAILNLTAELGGLSIFDQFIFATPFALVNDETVVTMNGDGQLNGVGFVSKRIGLSLNLAGVNIENLAVFEDVDFPSPFTDEVVYNLGYTNNIPGDQTPTWGFGNQTTISGQTISGISVEGILGICFTDDLKEIKKRSFFGKVNPACAGEPSPPEKSLLAFDFHSWVIEGINLGGVDLEAEAIFTPLAPATIDIGASFTLLDLVDIDVDLETSLPSVTSKFRLSGLSASVSVGTLSISFSDTDGDLAFDTGFIFSNITLNPNQNPATLTTSSTLIEGEGLTSQVFTLNVRRADINLSTTTVFFKDFFSTEPILRWASTNFSLSAVIGDVLNFSGKVSASPEGLSGVSIELGIEF